MTDSRIIFIGAPETAAADFPGIDLTAATTASTRRRAPARPWPTSAY